VDLFIAAVLLATTADPAPPSGDHTMHRAGYPRQVAWWAVPGRTGKVTGGQVGGGALRGGLPPGPGDGTWGYDYVGHGRWPHRVFLGWAPAERERPGIGPYATEGGPHVPDVFAIKPVKRALERRHAPAEHE
jgi:hypothetical protein